MKLLLTLYALCVLSLIPACAPAQSRADNVRAQVREILASPEFRVTPTEPSLLDRALKRLGNFIEDIFDRIGRLFRLRGGSAGGNIAFWIVFIALIAGMGTLSAYALRRFESRKTARTVPGDGVESEPDSNEPEDWLALAQALAGRGDFRRAYRAMFRALLLRLDAAGIIRFEPSRTNGEYMRALRSTASVHSIVRPAAEGFDILWYGCRPATEQDFQNCRAAYESIAHMTS